MDIVGDVVTADAMSMQKEIIDKIRQKNGDFVTELKANQRSLRYVIEDRIKTRLPLQTYTEDALLGHGRIETRTYRVYDGLELVADKEKWDGNLTVVEFESDTVKKSTGTHACEKRLYVSNLPADASQLGAVIRSHWSMESTHWTLGSNFLQDKIKRKSMKAAGNLDTLQRLPDSERIG